MFGGNRVGVLRAEPEHVEHVEHIPTGRRPQGLLDVLAAVITALSLVYIVLTFPITIWRCGRIIQEYERAVIFRLGRLIKDRVKGPGNFGAQVEADKQHHNRALSAVGTFDGQLQIMLKCLFWIIPWLDEIQTVDLRTVCVDIEPQQVLTADSVSLEVDAVLFYRVEEPVLWVTQVHDGPQVTRLLAQTSLRAAVGSHSLSQIINQRRSMAQKMEEAIKAASRPWGIQVQRVELRGLALPVDLLRCLALEAETQRHARAKLICAQGELGASLALKQAASSLSPIALQLRYLQSLSCVHSSTSVIVTAVPMEIIGKFMSKNT